MARTTEPDDKPKRSRLHKKRYWALAIIVIIIATAACGSTKSTSSTSSAASANTSASSSPTTSATPTSNLTLSQQNAVKAAQNYLSISGFSKQGLIDQLSSPAGDKYPVHDATVAVNSLQHVDWNAEAVKSAKEYMSTSSFSCQGLIQQLSSSAGSKYTAAQATYAATKVGLCSAASGDGATTGSAGSPVSSAGTTQSSSNGSLRACDQNISVNSVTTSCAFADNVFKAYAQDYKTKGAQPSDVVSASSPVTNKTYNMLCTSDGTTVECSGGNNSFVTFPLQAVRAY